jgi:hypothetical protein
MDRRGDASSRATTPAGAAAAAPQTTPAIDVAGARRLLASWLRAGRQARNLTLVEVAKITKIQSRTLEHLEAGRFDQLPADVFVRGFVRSYARCVGLDADEAVRRYSECGTTPGPVATPAARALIDSMAELVPTTVHVIQDARPPEAPGEASAAPVEPAVALGSSPAIALPEPKPRKKQRGKGRRARSRQRVAQGSIPPPGVEPVATAEELAEVAEVVAVADEVTVALETAPLTPAPSPAPTQDEPPVVEAAPPPAVEPPPPAVAPMRSSRITIPPPAAPVVPRRTSRPSLVIDDANPELAASEQEERGTETDADRKSFLPPNLLDNLLDGERPRQGGLTLAVIILLIAATLTLSYLMRRPSSAGEGMTAIPTQRSIG